MNAQNGHLDIGGVFDSTTEIYKNCFGTVWIVALVLLIPANIIVALLGNGILGIIGSLISLAASAWLMGSIIKIVQDVEADGRVDMSVGEILGAVWPRIIPIILLEIVVGILVAIGLVFLIVPGVILALMWAVSLPALVVEDKGVFDSMSRSSDLTRENRMRILGLAILILILYLVLIIVVALLAAITPILGIIVGIVLGVLIYPYIAIISTVLYFNLVELKEGLVMASETVVEETLIVDEGPADPPPAV